jgi:hypothetical protein
MTRCSFPRFLHRFLKSKSKPTWTSAPRWLAVLALGLALPGCEKKKEKAPGTAATPVPVPAPAAVRAAMAAVAEPPFTPDPEMMDFLQKIYAAHGAKAEIQGDWVIVEGGKLKTQASYDGKQGKKDFILQADFVTRLDSGETIIESFGGVGEDLKKAKEDAYRAFMDSTFHALLSVGLGQPCEHADTDEWEIGGSRRKITYGLLRMRGTLPENSWPPVIEDLKKLVQESGLPKGLHWVRYFYAQIPGGEPTVELMLDNETWEPLQKKAAGLPWPESKDYYSARLFFMVQDDG